MLTIDNIQEMPEEVKYELKRYLDTAKKQKKLTNALPNEEKGISINYNARNRDLLRAMGIWPNPKGASRECGPRERKAGVERMGDSGMQEVDDEGSRAVGIVTDDNTSGDHATECGCADLGGVSASVEYENSATEQRDKPDEIVAETEETGDDLVEVRGMTGAGHAFTIDYLERYSGETVSVTKHLSRTIDAFRRSFKNKKIRKGLRATCIDAQLLITGLAHHVSDLAGSFDDIPNGEIWLRSEYACDKTSSITLYLPIAVREALDQFICMNNALNPTALMNQLLVEALIYYGEDLAMKA